MARITESAKQAVSITPIKANTFLKWTYPFTGLIQPEAVLTYPLDRRQMFALWESDCWVPHKLPEWGTLFPVARPQLEGVWREGGRKCTLLLHSKSMALTETVEQKARLCLSVPYTLNTGAEGTLDCCFIQTPPRCVLAAVATVPHSSFEFRPPPI